MGKNRKRNNKKKNTNPSTNKSNVSSDQKESSPVAESQVNEGDEEGGVTVSTVTEESTDTRPDKVAGDDKEDKEGVQESEVTVDEDSGDDTAVVQEEPVVNVVQLDKVNTGVDCSHNRDDEDHNSDGGISGNVSGYSERGGDCVKDVSGDSSQDLNLVEEEEVSDKLDSSEDATSSGRVPDRVKEKTPSPSRENSDSQQQREGECHEDDDDVDDDDDASLSDLVQQGGGEDDDYVAVAKSTSDDHNKGDDSGSPNSNSSYVMVAGEDEEEQHQWVDPLSLPPSSPATEGTVNEEGEVGRSIRAYSEGEGNDDQEGFPLRVQESHGEDRQGARREEPVVTQVEESNEEEGDGYYADDFEEEDGVVVDEGGAIQQHLQQQQEMLQARIEKDDKDEGKVDLSLEPRVTIALALKVVHNLRKKRVLDGRSSGQVKDMIFGGDLTILRAVEEFIMTQSVERLVSVIHSVSL